MLTDDIISTNRHKVYFCASHKDSVSVNGNGNIAVIPAMMKTEIEMVITAGDMVDGDVISNITSGKKLCIVGGKIGVETGDMASVMYALGSPVHIGNGDYRLDASTHGMGDTMAGAQEEGGRNNQYIDGRLYYFDVDQTAYPGYAEIIVSNLWGNVTLTPSAGYKITTTAIDADDYSDEPVVVSKTTAELASGIITIYVLPDGSVVGETLLSGTITVSSDNMKSTVIPISGWALPETVEAPKITIDDFAIEWIIDDPIAPVSKDLLVQNIVNDEVVTVTSNSTSVVMATTQDAVSWSEFLEFTPINGTVDETIWFKLIDGLTADDSGNVTITIENRGAKSVDATITIGITAGT